MPRLTKNFVERLESPEVGQQLYFDDSLKGFGVRLTPGAKTYIVQSRAGGKVRRVKIGRHGVLTAEEARNEAKRILGLMANDVDPNARKSAERVKAVTLGQVFEEYLQARNLKPGTAYGYRKIVDRCLSDWLDKPVTSITKDMVESCVFR